MLAAGHMHRPLLPLHLLFIESDVQETRRLKNLADVLDHVKAHAVVRLRGDHAMILLEPLVVSGGEVELRYRLQPHLAETPHLGTHPVGRPAALHGQLRVARILHELAEIHHHHIEVALLGVVDVTSPDVLGEVDLVTRIALTLDPRFVRRKPFAPHVHAHVQQHAANPIRTLRKRWNGGKRR